MLLQSKQTQQGEMEQYFKICIRIAVAPFCDTDCSDRGKKNKPQTFPKMNTFFKGLSRKMMLELLL